MVDKEYYRNKTSYSYEDLTRIVSDLRGDDGCPWDREQTHESLIDCMIEECYEAVGAIRSGDMENLREELGDVLLQVVMHSEIAGEEGFFTIEDVIQGLCEKLVRRHPHVFGDMGAVTPEEGLRNWETIKRSESKSESEADKNELERVPAALPALTRAKKVLRKADKAGLSNESVQDLAKGLREDLEALENQGVDADQGDLEALAGDFLLKTTNLLGKMGINPENSLTTALEQYITILSGA